VTGVYSDANNVNHGFLREPDRGLGLAKFERP